MMLRRVRPAALVLALLCAGCVFSSLRVRELQRPSGDAYRVSTPAKAHLTDGGVIVYVEGVEITRDQLIGNGVRFDLLRTNPQPVYSHALADVVAIEAFSTDVDAASSTAATLVGAPLVVLGSVVLLKALFGSCPTVYTDTGAGPSLQAELFSYSIAPMFEARDVDRIDVRPDATGHFVVEIRNEALETHYINQLQMIEIRHAPEEIVVPDAAGRPVALRGLRALSAARDRLGVDRLGELAEADGRAFRTAREVVDSAVTGELEDWLEITAARPAGDSAAVVLRMRNSLLNTVLLYDVLLAGRGAAALDWVGRDLGRVDQAAGLGRWYSSRMGMRVAVLDGGTWRPAGRIPDTGPIAWKDVAIVIAVPKAGDSLHVRLEFVADNWRIDQVRIADGVRRPAVHQLAAESVTGPDGREDSTARAAVLTPDERYLRTTPGDWFTVHWNAGALPGDSARTFLLASQGYYIEWIRRDWLTRERATPPGTYQDDLLRRALAGWVAQQDDYERRFERTRIPVR